MHFFGDRNRFISCSPSFLIAYFFRILFCFNSRLHRQLTIPQLVHVVEQRPDFRWDVVVDLDDGLGQAQDRLVNGD